MLSHRCRNPLPQAGQRLPSEPCWLHHHRRHEAHWKNIHPPASLECLQPLASHLIVAIAVTSYSREAYHVSAAASTCL
jgi:hypothetical protein